MGAAPVEEPGLDERIEDAAGAGAGARDPLPAELVVDDLAVHEEVQEVPGADRPVDVQPLVQEASRRARLRIQPS